jgi:hypothetical protein
MSTEGPAFEEGDDDDTKKAKVKAWMENWRESMRPHTEALVAHCTEAEGQGGHGLASSCSCVRTVQAYH